MRTPRLTITLLLAATLLTACPNPAKKASTALADAEITLTTAVQASDNALDVACADVKSDGCGRMLAAHKKGLAAVNVAYAAVKTARADLTSGNSSGVMTAVDTILAMVREINRQRLNP